MKSFCRSSAESRLHFNFNINKFFLWSRCLKNKTSYVYQIKLFVSIWNLKFLCTYSNKRILSLRFYLLNLQNILLMNKYDLKVLFCNNYITAFILIHFQELKNFTDCWRRWRYLNVKRYLKQKNSNMENYHYSCNNKKIKKFLINFPTIFPIFTEEIIQKHLQ